MSPPLRSLGRKLKREVFAAQLGIIALGMLLAADWGVVPGFLYFLFALTLPLGWLGRFLPAFYDMARGRSDAQDQLLAVRQLADLLRVGVSVPEALEALAGAEEHNWRARYASTCQALRQMAQTTACGDRLGPAMSATDAFPEHWGRLLDAAEGSDALLDVLAELEWGRSPHPWVASSMQVRFPVMLVILLGVAFFLTTYILPTFVTLYEGMELRLPWPTLLTIRMTKFLRNPDTALPVLIGCSLLWAMQRRFPMRWPVFGAISDLEEQAVVANTLALCGKLRMTTAESLRVASAAVRQPRYRKALQSASQSSSLGEVLAGHPELFEAPLRWLVQQGERMGNLEEALLAGARSLASRADFWKGRLSVALDTLGVCVLGALVGFLIFATYLPVLGIVDHVMIGRVLP